MTQKPSTMLADLIGHEVTDDEKFDINFNVQQYKQLCQ
jgi:CYTH domain-containing protein